MIRNTFSEMASVSNPAIATAIAARIVIVNLLP
jgi:hypothetical protein